MTDRATCCYAPRMLARASTMALAAAGLAALVVACGTQGEPETPDAAPEAASGDDAGDPFPGVDGWAPPPWDGALPAPVCVPSKCPSALPEAGTGCVVSYYDRCEYGDDAGCALSARCSCGNWVISSSGQCVADVGTCPATLDAGASACAQPGQLCDLADGECLCTKGGAWDCRAQLPSCPRPRPKLGSACDVDGGGCLWLFSAPNASGDLPYSCCGTWSRPSSSHYPPPPC